MSSFPATPMEPTAHPRAVPSLVLGVLAVVCFGFVTGIPAMVLGRRAMREIDASGGQRGGRGLAKAGFITGLVGSVLGGLLVVVFVFELVALATFDTTGSQMSETGVSAPRWAGAVRGS